MRVKSDIFKAPESRLSFAHELFRPADTKAGKIYKCNLILDYTAREELTKIVDEVAVKAFGEDAIDGLMSGAIRSPILAGDGDEARDKSGNIRDGLGKDTIFIRVSSTFQPKFYEKTEEGVIPVCPGDDEELFASGNYVFPAINAYSWDNGESKGVAFGITMMCFSREGDKFGSGGSRVDPNDIF